MKNRKREEKKEDGMTTSGSDKSPTTERITTKKMATTTKNDKITRTKNNTGSGDQREILAMTSDDMANAMIRKRKNIGRERSIKMEAIEEEEDLAEEITTEISRASNRG